MRRRRTKSTWFPILPTYFGDEGSPGVTWYQSTLTLSGTQTGDTGITAVPLTLDDTSEFDNDVDQQSLRDYVEGQDYLLQRVVGKVWFSQDTGSAESAGIQSIGCIALAVLPSEPGTNSPALPAEEWNPLFARNAAQPWIWRRTWKIDPPDTWNGPDNAGFAGRGFPNSSAWYGSIADGGHLDSKVKRRITKEHRLFLIAAAGLVLAGGEGSTQYSFGYDLRVLGQMRRGKNTSTF